MNNSRTKKRKQNVDVTEFIDQDEDFYFDPALDDAIEREMLQIEKEQEFREKLRSAEDEIFKDADKIVLQKGDNLTDSKVILVGSDGRYIKSKVISNKEMINLFRNITKTYLVSSNELKSIRNQVTKEFYNNKKENN